MAISRWRPGQRSPSSASARTAASAVRAFDWIARMQKHISSNSRSSGSDPTRRNSARRASISSRFAAYSERRTRTSRYLGTARKARTRDKSIRHRSRSGLTRRLNNGFRYEATMSLLYSLARALDRFSPAPVAYAHCDIPCGIYDPHPEEMAAHTVVRMIDPIHPLAKPGPNATAEHTPADDANVDRFGVRRPRRGDLVVVRDPELSDRFLVKRVSETEASTQIPLEGDNAAVSRDSRAFGAVPLDRIVGKVWLRLKP